MRAARRGFLAATLMAGCASNPYIQDTRPPTQPQAQILDRGSVAYAIAYADNTYDAYRAKLREEYDRQQLISGSLMTLMTVGIGAAVGNAHRDVLIASALSGALIYQLGSWNSNDDRLLIYVEGMKAMSCLKGAVAPLRVLEPSRKAIGVAEGEVKNELDAAAQALAELTRWLHVAGASQSPNSETAQAARTEVTEFGVQAREVTALLEKSSILAQRIDSAGPVLESRIQTIIGTIDDAQRTKSSRLSSLTQHIGGIMQFANVLAPNLNFAGAFNDHIAAINKRLPSAPGSTTEGLGRGGRPPLSTEAPRPVEPREALAGALGNLRAARIRLAASASRLSGLIERPISQVQSDMAGCGVDPEKVAHRITLRRNPVYLPAGQARTALVDVEGATPSLSVSLLDLPAKGVNVAVAGSTAVLVATDVTSEPGSTYQARVQDGTGASAVLTIRIDGAPADTTSPARSCSGPRSTDRALICLVQNIARIAPTGEMNPATCDAIFTSGLSTTGQLDDDLRARALAAKQQPTTATDATLRNLLSTQEQRDCKLSGTSESTRGRSPATLKPAATPVANARTDFERSLGPGDVRAISRRLGMNPPVDDLSDDFRRALGNFQRDNGWKDTRGDLTPDDARKLLR